MGVNRLFPGDYLDFESNQYAAGRMRKIISLSFAILRESLTEKRK